MRDANGNWIQCCIKGCDRTPIALGLCVNHWRRNRKYGSPVASAHHPGMFSGLSAETRFWMQTKKVAGEGCWNWTSGTDQDGYGAFLGVFDGVTYRRAHRFSFALHFDHPQKGMHVCHRCDNPQCVRPDHLFIGSPQENVDDKMSKGRHRAPAGENHHRAVLTEAQVRAVLLDPRPYAQIAAEYGVTSATIGDVKSRKSWPHLGKERGVKAKRVSPRKGISDKITPEIVREIRGSTERGVDLAARFGVTRATITDIRKRRSWAHIE